MLYPAGAMVMPDDVTALIIDVLRRRHGEHLARLERERGLEPRTLEPLATVDYLAAEGWRLKRDAPPCALVGTFGTADPPDRGRDGYRVSWTVAVEVTVMGAHREDTIRRRDWYAMTVLECVLDRVPRNGQPVDAVAWEDMDLVPGVDEQSQQILGQARILFSVTTAQAVGRHALPPDDSGLEPGTPGAAPVDPYTSPVQLPTVTKATTTTVKETPS